LGILPSVKIDLFWGVLPMVEIVRIKKHPV